MKRLTLTAIGVLLLAAVSLLAHHSYALFYDVHQQVILKGKVTKVSFTAPHAKLTIETKNSGTWVAELTNLEALKRTGVSDDTIKAGDFLEIEGSPALNPDSRVVSALREIRRPVDGWRWVSEAKWPGPRVIE